ncbi:hypothetical protein PoB_001781200 [Plakobranchus ocellatus]|uniref:Uncharacterized protein n=1 Tax=Plakobranchus ocellatus TaxID=259542 RepID=A0AAV3Z7T7_9GAST|nr:hypothetical protein PoB_001781200 [Plakobranchus ocellatus]
MLLLEHYSKNDLIQLRRSGTEELCGERESLLQTGKELEEEVLLQSSATRKKGGGNTGHWSVHEVTGHGL